MGAAKVGEVSPGAAGLLAGKAAGSGSACMGTLSKSSHQGHRLGLFEKEVSLQASQQAHLHPPHSLQR
jgi:hypothetical protein